MNKFSKGKIAAITCASLAAVSLMGVGFSTWIFKSTNDAQTGDISVEVADTVDASVTIDTNENSPKIEGKLRFDADKTATDGQLLTASNDSEESLSFKLSFTVDVTQYATGWNVTAMIENYDTSDLKKAVDSKYITLPTDLSGTETAVISNDKNITDSNSGLTVSVSGNTTKAYTVTKEYIFGWGAAFANKNPSQITSSDQLESTSDNTKTGASAEELKTRLKALKDLNVTNFKIQLKANITSTTISSN